ncbi:MAG: transposase [Candidatus Acidiferrum sp.]
MRNPLERRYGQGDLHFIIFSCFGRRPLLGTPPSRDCFVRKLGEVRIRYSFRLIGYVVMPEHVHLLLSEPTAGDLSIVLQVLKQRVSRTLLAKRADGKPIAESHFWMRRFYDFTGAGSTRRRHSAGFGASATWSPPGKCLDWEEADREAALHAFESGEQKSRNASEELDLE